MPVPAKRRASSQKGRRRSHDALEKQALTKCPQCGKAVRPHRACSFCGTYRGRTILTIKTKTKKSKSAS